MPKGGFVIFPLSPPLSPFGNRGGMVKTSVTQTSEKNTSQTTRSLKFDRVDVLAQLWKNSQWLNDKIHLKQLKVNGALRQRVYMVQVQSGVCKVILAGLKDEELELRVKKLEELMKDAVMIPHEQKR